MLIYAICLVVGLLFTIISAVAGHLFGGDHGGDVGTGGHAEAGFDHSGVPGISFFSPTVMCSFVTAFGAFGRSVFAPTGNRVVEEVTTVRNDNVRRPEVIAMRRGNASSPRRVCGERGFADEPISEVGGVQRLDAVAGGKRPELAVTRNNG